MGVNIAAVTRTIRGYFRTDSPGFLQKVVDDTLKSGNQMDVQPDEYLETLEWLQEELQAELNDPNYRIPIDVEEADFLFGFNAREVKYYPNELQKISKIFCAAGVNYTLSSQKWDATNLALFSGKDGAKIVAIPCHNCMDQFNDLNKHHQLGMNMEHICSLVE
ncbi:hypothetical protein [Desulfofundulus thermocisternus]|uniref:hypothetical protein n=1 Tax=Desulfofundulus thermocisternus TaxID=42471 RepID=UPI00217EF957|nr:hypothetical protein [Desulfofundulus thermocisternus]